MLPDLPKTGRVRHVLFAQYVTTNMASGAMSFIDVLDGLRTAVFPIEFQIFVVTMLENAIGDFEFSFTIAIPEKQAVESASLHIPFQNPGRTNIAVPSPRIVIEAPVKLSVTLQADRVPFHQESFEISKIEAQPFVSISQKSTATNRP